MSDGDRDPVDLFLVCPHNFISFVRNSHGDIAEAEGSYFIMDTDLEGTGLWLMGALHVDVHSAICI